MHIQNEDAAVDAEPRVGIQLEVLTKKDGKWLISSFQNTASLPEPPAPL